MEKTKQSILERLNQLQELFSYILTQFIKVVSKKFGHFINKHHLWKKCVLYRAGVQPSLHM